MHITNSKVNVWIKRRVGCKFARTQETKETKAACRPEHDVILGAKIQRTLNNYQNIDSDGKALGGRRTLHTLNPPKKPLKLQTIEKRIC